MNNTNFSKKLRSAIKQNGISQSDLAFKTGITPSSISDWLNGKYVPKQDKIYILATALNVKPSYLFGWEDSEDNIKVSIQRINMDYFIKQIIIRGWTLNSFFEFYFEKFIGNSGWSGYSDFSFANIEQLKARYADLYYGREIITYGEQKEFNCAYNSITYDFDDNTVNFSIKEISEFLSSPKEKTLIISEASDIDYDISNSAIEAERAIKLYQLRGNIEENDAVEYLLKVENIYSEFIPYLENNFNSEIKENFLPFENTNKFKPKVQIPVLGVVPCGEPIEAIEDVIEWIDVVPSQAKKHFGLIAKGDSMSPYILDGDILIVKYTPEVNSGKIAIVKVNGDEATCKRLVISDTGVMLMPYNPTYEPISFTPQEVEEKPVMIIGEVVEIRRRFSKR